VRLCRTIRNLNDEIYLAVIPEAASGNNVRWTGMHKCDEMNIIGRPPVSPPSPAPLRNWRSCFPQQLAEQQHAWQSVFFYMMLVLRYLQYSHTPETPSVFFVLQVVELRLIHSILIVV
jgi:hypothetical protein